MLTVVLLQATLELTNPGDQHLSADEFGLPKFFLIYLLVIAGLMVIWAANGVYNWRVSN